MKLQEFNELQTEMERARQELVNLRKKDSELEQRKACIRWHILQLWYSIYFWSNLYFILMPAIIPSVSPRSLNCTFVPSSLSWSGSSCAFRFSLLIWLINSRTFLLAAALTTLTSMATLLALLLFRFWWIISWSGTSVLALFFLLVFFFLVIFFVPGVSWVNDGLVGIR